MNCFRYLALLALLMSRLQPLPAATYYVDSAGGSDSNNGTATNTAWQTLAKINGTTFQPGDSIYLKTGGSWTGTLNPQGSGTNGAPIVMSSYGTNSALPLINGNGATDALALTNQQYWEISGLEVINPGSGTSSERRGIHLVAANAGQINHLYVSNCFVHNICGRVDSSNGDSLAKRTGGIVVEVVSDSSASTWFNDVSIQNCTITSVTNQGIVACGNVTGGSDFPGTANWNKRHCTNLVIRNNVISQVCKNAMSIRYSDESCLVEHNLMHDTANTTDGNQICSYSTRGTVFQYNEGYHNNGNGSADGSMYDADLNSPQTVWQYSYSHDNTWGLWVDYTGGADNNVVVRYNISQNDQGQIFHFSGSGTASIYLYNNIIYIPTNLSPYVFYDNTSGHTYYAYNNIFYNLSSGAKYSFTGGNTRTFDHNVFYDAFKQPSGEPVDTNGITTDPMLVAPGTGGGVGGTNNMASLGGYKLQAGSPCIDSGLVVTTNMTGNPNAGGLDFFGNPVPYGSVPDRGAGEYTVAGNTPPTITQPPQSIAIISGYGTNFTVMASGTAPLAYQWRLNGQPINGASGTSLIFAAVGTNDGGSYDVVVTNIAGAVTSIVAALTVLPPPTNTPPAITQPPQSITITNGYGTNFTVAASGTAPLAYQWRLNGQPINGASGTNLIFVAVATTNAGNYDVVVTNLAGAVTSVVATLTVLLPPTNTPPTITQPPQNVTANAGATVTFNVTANGSAPLAYQWRYGGIPVSSATNQAYTLVGVTTNNAGNYDVLVTNAFGAVTSSVAVLSVATPSGGEAGTVVIAEVYPGGGKSGAAYSFDYVVLKNISGLPVNLTNWSLQYDKVGVWQTPLVLTNVTLPAGGYYLIQCYNDGGTPSGAPLPTPDAITLQSSVWNMSTASAGAVALVNGPAILTSCASSNIMDLVGWYTPSGNCYQGTGVAPAGTATQSIQRKNNGCQSTGDNSVDFALGTPSPENSVSPAAPCQISLALPAVTNLSPVVFPNSAQLDASVNPGGAATLMYIRFGVATNYGSFSSTNVIQAGTNAVGVTNLITGLLPGTLYHYQAWVTNSAGATNTPDAVFTTTAITPPIIGSLTVSTGGVFQCAFTNTPGAMFEMLATTNLSLPRSNWTLLGPVTEAPAGQYQFSDPEPLTNEPVEYYQLRSP